MQSENGQCLRAGFDRAFGVKGMAHSDPALQGLGVGEGGEGGGGGVAGAPPPPPQASSIQTPK